MWPTSEHKRLLKSRSTEDRLKGVRLMAQDPSLTDVPMLIKLVHDRSQIVAARAVRLLADRSCYEAVSELIERYLWLHEKPTDRDPGCTVRSEIVLALGTLAGRRGIDILRLALKTVQVEVVSGGLEDTATGLRANAAVALANAGDQSALTDLAILLFDMKPNHEVAPSEKPYAKVATRVAAARALGQLGYPAAEALLAAKLCNPDGEVPEVLVECMDALVAVESERCIEWIGPLLEHKEPYIVAGAATALAATGQPEVAELLYHAVSLAVRDAREAIVLSLAALRNDKALRYLIAFLRDPDPGVRAAAEQALESFPETAVAEAKEHFVYPPTLKTRP